MAYSKISILKLLSILLLALYAKVCTAQLVLSPSAMSASLFTYSHEPLQRLSEGYYVVATERNCSSCFAQACESLKTLTQPNEQINLLIFTSQKVFATIALHNSYKKLTPCASNILFCFLQSADSTILRYAQQPSPLIAHCIGDSLILYNYEQSKKIWDK